LYRFEVLGAGLDGRNVKKVEKESVGLEKRTPWRACKNISGGESGETRDKRNMLNCSKCS